MSRQSDWQDKHKRHNLCTYCSEPRHKKYRLCEEHLRSDRLRKRATLGPQMRKRKA